MRRLLLTAAGLSLGLAAAAQAQTPATQAPASEATPAAAPPAAASAPAASADASATTSPYKAGMTIRDAQGATVGTIARVVKTPDGATTISASIDGRNVNLPASALTVSGSGVVSSMSKSQITASTAPPT